ncbi:bifunctional DNA primase/polymerase [Streptomyces sp. HNA39]|uniref:bifunctional DNA primase/polymerase n=1 Tax=Streptomyces sp. HNA39 TaxID=2850561 RepID=UPI00200CE24A|nr:bifunctional DNA primase/polymerase [Streptomyces sp. HNA39]UQA35251.1 bifunctional DNA primase/polymerase [Streptomyces sp. HNA39]
MATIDRQTATLALAHALAAAGRGLPVFPLSATKLPALRSPHHGEQPPVHCRGECGLPGHGVHDATTDPAAVRALFAAAPRATGYGIACGRAPHRLIGIDLDIDTAYGNDSVGALQQLALQHLFTIPPTVTVLTPSGGRHLWLTGPADTPVPNSAGRLAAGIDVRGSGGYLVGPGSVTTRGRYRLAPGTARLTPAPCPRALLRLLTPPRRAPGTLTSETPPGRRGEGLIHFVLAAHEGQRNTRLFWAACRAYEHGFGDALSDALTAAAIRTGLTEQEARAAIASAERLTRGRK